MCQHDRERQIQAQERSAGTGLAAGTLPAVLGGAILAGGAARRFGGMAKALLPVEPGVTVAAKLAREMRLAGVGEIVVLSGRDLRLAETGLELVPDDEPGLGPLGGIATGLRRFEGRADGVLFVAGDMPGVAAGELRALRAAFESGGGIVVAAGEDGLWQPLCAIVSARLRPPVAAALRAGERSPGRLWRQLGGRAVRCGSDAAFHNVNAPEDLEAWQALSRRADLPGGAVSHG